VAGSSDGNVHGPAGVSNLVAVPGPAAPSPTAVLRRSFLRQRRWVVPLLRRGRVAPTALRGPWLMARIHEPLCLGCRDPTASSDSTSTPAVEQPMGSRDLRVQDRQALRVTTGCRALADSRGTGERPSALAHYRRESRSLFHPTHGPSLLCLAVCDCPIQRISVLLGCMHVLFTCCRCLKKGTRIASLIFRRV
jgi:hypothetical protein